MFFGIFRIAVVDVDEILIVQSNLAPSLNISVIKMNINLLPSKHFPVLKNEQHCFKNDNQRP